MPTFEYAYHPSPFANSIAELLAHQNDPAAQAARIKGNLSARAIEASGQATSDLIHGITHAGTSALDSILQAQQQAPVVAANKIKLEQLQQAQGAQNELSRALEGDQLPAGDAGPRRPSLTSADGGYDLPAIGAWLNSRGAGAQAPEILQHLQQTNVAVAEAKLKQTAAAEAQTIADGRMAFTMYQGMALGMSPEQAYTGAVVPAKQSALYTPEQLEQKRSQLLSLPPDQLNARLTQMMTAAEQVGPKTKVGAEETVFGVLGRPIAKGASKPLTETELALKAAGTDPATGEPNYPAAMTLMKPPPKPSATEQEDGRYETITAAATLGRPVAPADAAWARAYEQRKKLTVDASASAAADRQAAAIGQATAQQKRAQDFQQLQAARADIQKNVDTPYLTARTSADTLRDVVSAAKAGNKVAGSLQSLEATMAAIRAQGLNRVNTAEIGATGNAGSLWDRISGYVGKKLEGQPVPADIQKDMIEFADILDKAAAKKYHDGHDAVNKLYGTTIPKTFQPAAPGPAATPPPLTPGLAGLAGRK